VETARSAERVAAARQRGVALHEIAVLCTTNELCRRAVEALRQAGVPAYPRNTDDYRLTPLHRAGRRLRGVGVPGPRDKQLPAGFAAAAMAFNPGHRTHSRTGRSVARAECGRGVPADCRGRSSSAAPASARKVHVVLGFQSGHRRILSDIGNGLEEGQRAPH
jgi:hypothetical protein